MTWWWLLTMTLLLPCMVLWTCARRRRLSYPRLEDTAIAGEERLRQEMQLLECHFCHEEQAVHVAQVSFLAKAMVALY